MSKTSLTSEEPKAQSPGKNGKAKVRNLTVVKLTETHFLNPKNMVAAMLTLVESIPQLANAPTERLSELQVLFRRDFFQAWWLITDDGRKAGCVVTTVQDDPFGRRSMTIVAMRAYQLISADAWFNAFQQAEEEARKMGCTHLEFLSDNPVVDRLGENLNFHRQNRWTKEL